MLRFIAQLWTDAWTVAVTKARQEDSAAAPPTAWGELALEVARGQIGAREEGGNNRGEAVRLYRGDSKAAAWCAAFVWWCFKQAAARLGLRLPFAGSHGAKALYRAIGRAGAFVDYPRPGDAACWQRGNGTKADRWKGHIGIVSRVDGDRFWTIEGNAGAYPAPVREIEHRIGERRLIGFARL